MEAQLIILVVCVYLLMYTLYCACIAPKFATAMQRRGMLDEVIIALVVPFTVLARTLEEYGMPSPMHEPKGGWHRLLQAL